jgi:hypothetical protein
LLRMKCRFLRLQICDQGLKPFNRDLIANRQEHSPVMLNLFVDFGALVAHGEPRSNRVPRQLLLDAHWYRRLDGKFVHQAFEIRPEVPLTSQKGPFTSVTTAPAMTPIR